MSPKQKPNEAAALVEARAKSPDVMLVHGVSDDGKSLAVLRARDDRLEAGVVRAIGEGEPIQGEVVRLTPRPACPVVCDVEVTVPRGALNAPGSAERPEARAQRSGPAQVATDRYRDNWDAIWQRPRNNRDDLPN